MSPMALTKAHIVILWGFSIKYKYFYQSLVCVAYSIHMFHENTLLESKFLTMGHIAPWGHRILVGPCKMIITFEPL